MDDDRIENEALGWLLALADPRFEKWEELTAWLAISPEHARIFNMLQIREAALLEELALQSQTRPRKAPDVEVANDDRPWASRGFLVKFAASVAVLAVGLWITTEHHLKDGPGSAWKEIRTAAGGRNKLQMADGSRVELNGASAVTVAPGGREARLLTGQAFFTVSHNPSQPFKVIAGDTVITDLGTEFDVVRETGQVTVRVVQGEVGVSISGRRSVRLGAGQGAVVSGGSVSTFTASRATTTAWRQGRLHFEDAPMDMVIVQIERTTGLHVQNAPQSAARRFTGTLQLDGPPDALRRRIALLLGVKVNDPPLEAEAKEASAIRDARR